MLLRGEWTKPVMMGRQTGAASFLKKQAPWYFHFTEHTCQADLFAACFSFSSASCACSAAMVLCAAATASSLSARARFSSSNRACSARASVRSASSPPPPAPSTAVQNEEHVLTRNHLSARLPTLPNDARSHSSWSQSSSLSSSK